MKSHHDVIVVGAGAAGLTAAVTLARAGVKVVVVESRPSGGTLPRATVLSVRTMEILRFWGLESAIRAGADKVEMTLREIPTVARAGEGNAFEVGYPTAAQSAVVSPTAAVCVAQDHLETVLTDYLVTLPAATLSRGVEVLDMAAHPDGAVVTARDTSGRERTMTAAYVIGADGAKSVVRAALGIVLHGPGAVVESVSVQFRARLWELLGEHRHLLYTTTEPGAEGVLLPAGQGDRWLFGMPFGFALRPGSRPTVDELRAHIERAIGVPGVKVAIDRFGHYTAGAQLAASFSRHTAYLVGDAAHRVTPRGGTGLNVAVADGFDLAWKLGWVLRGWAPPSFLTTYESERRPPVAHNVERSADPNGARRLVVTELLVDLGGRIQHVWTDDGRSTVDLLGDGLTLFTAGASTAEDDAGDGDAWTHAASALGPSVPIAVARLTPIAGRSLGLPHGGALLARPDGKPVASWPTAATAADNLTVAVRSLIERRDVGATGREDAA